MTQERIEIEQKHKTIPQAELIDQLVQSKVLTKREFEQITKTVDNKIETAKDASIVITYLLATIEYRKRFLAKNKGNREQCLVCKNKKDLHRYIQLPEWKQQSICKKCVEQYYKTMNEVEASAISLIEDCDIPGMEKRITIPTGEQ